MKALITISISLAVYLFTPRWLLGKGPENDFFWFPRIKRVELHATRAGTESLIVEYIEP